MAQCSPLCITCSWHNPVFSSIKLNKTVMVLMYQSHTAAFLWFITPIILIVICAFWWGVCMLLSTVESYHRKRWGNILLSNGEKGQAIKNPSISNNQPHQDIARILRILLISFGWCTTWVMIPHRHVSSTPWVTSRRCTYIPILIERWALVPIPSVPLLGDTLEIWPRRCLWSRVRCIDQFQCSNSVSRKCFSSE